MNPPNPQPKRRGRPAIPTSERRGSLSLRLTPKARQRLDALSSILNVSQGKIVSELLENKP